MTTGRPTVDTSDLQATPAPLARPASRTDLGERAHRSAWSQTTRQLAAATYLDPALCDDVIDRVLEEPYLASPFNVGVDTTVVARHALEARRARLLADALLALAFTATVTVFLASVIVAVHTDQAFAWGGSWPGGFAWWILPGGIGVGAVVVGVHAWYVDHVVLAGRLSASTYRPQAAPLPRSARHRTRLEDVRSRQEGNVLVFSSYDPFAGSGILQGRYEVAVDVGKGDWPDEADRPPEPFDGTEVQAALVEGLRELGLRDLECEAKLLVPGDLVHLFRETLLPDPLRPPAAHATPEQIDAIDRDPDHLARAYVAVEVSGWAGQLVATTFVRTVRVEKALFLEWSVFGLLPLYELVDRADDLFPVDSLGAIRMAVRHGITGVWTRAPGSFERLAQAGARRWAALRRRRWQRARIVSGLRFDYGAPRSVREVATGDQTGRYFVSTDLHMYAAVTRERVFKVIERFLVDHHVDTGAFKVVQNNVVYNNTSDFRGATVSGNSGAIGGGASVTASPAAPGAQAGPKPAASGA